VMSSLVSNVASAYFQLLELDMEMAISTRTLQSRKESLRLVEIRQQGGTTSLIDVRQSEQLVYTAAASIPDTTVTDVLALIQDYDNHKLIYQPEVMDSKLISRQGNDFHIYLRLLKKKIITVVLDTDHQVHYRSIDRKRWLCRSRTTRIAEVENAGRQDERILEPDTGHGFLWRLYSYWRFEEREASVMVECRAISLTRDVPFGLGWAIEPIIQSLPKESLVNTLEATRRALWAKAK